MRTACTLSDLQKFFARKMNDRLQTVLKLREEHPMVTVTYFVPDQRKEGAPMSQWPENLKSLMNTKES